MTKQLENIVHSPFLRWLSERGVATPSHIRALMMEDLFGSASNILIGLAAELFVEIFFYDLTHSLAFLVILLANIPISIARAINIGQIGRARRRGLPLPIDQFMWIMIAWCSLCGLSGLFAMASNNPTVQIFGAVLVCVIALTACLRHYASFGFAVLIFNIVICPSLLGDILAQDHWLGLLALTFPSLLAVGVSIVFDMQKMARETLMTRDKSEMQARHDYLTGALNRFGLREKLSGLSSLPFAIFCLDLDRFKEVNDTFGHSAGDTLLQAVCARLMSFAGADEYVARLGGDEFLLLIPGGGPEDASRIAARLRRHLAGEPYDLSLESPIKVDVSIGYACKPADGSTFPALYHAADVRLYEAKQANREARTSHPA